jgi:outer membrane murein-binding lipoprotein Lpp
MKQYQTDPDNPVVAPIIKPKVDESPSQIRELEAKLAEQDNKINRMHRDIVRLREVINQLAAKIK